MMMLHLLTFLGLIANVTRQGQAFATCYGMEGNQMNSNYAPCNVTSGAINSDGNTHSACCNIANADICLSSGLCLSTVALALGRVLWISGCTDKTLQDPGCPQYCRNFKKDGSNVYFLRSCDPNQTANSWCCGVEGQSITECCSRSFRLQSNIGHIVQQLSIGNGSNSGSSNSANANDGVPFITPSFNQPLPSTGSSSKASTTSEATTSLDSKGLVAGISAVSVIAAVTILALAVVLLRARRLAGRTCAVMAAAPVQSHAASGSPPQVVEQHEASPCLPPTHHRSAVGINDHAPSHELSPISATVTELLEETGIGRRGRQSLGIGTGAEGPALRSAVVIAELPADTSVKWE